MDTYAAGLHIHRHPDYQGATQRGRQLWYYRLFCVEWNPPPLSPLDYLLVKYWDKNTWKSVAGSRKDTSEVQTKNGSRGGTRSSKGENIMMLYIEDANGTPIDGNTASGMRELARSIWRSMYERGIAPETWGQATKEVRMEYSQEMESEYHVLRLCNNHWKANALATAIYSQWYRTYDKKMKPSPDSDRSSEGDNCDGNNSDDDTGDVSDGPPRKKTKTTTIVNDDTYFTLPETKNHTDNEGTSIYAILTDANDRTDSSRSNLDVQCVEDNRSSSHPRTALRDPLYISANITILLIPGNASSNIFTQPTSQFRVLASVPDVIQRVGPNADQHDTSHISGAAAIENMVQTMDAANTEQHNTNDVTGAAVVENADQATDTTNTNIIAQAPNVVDIDNLHPTTSGLASTSTSMPAELPQTGDPVPIPSHTSTCTSPSPTDPTMSATTSTPLVDPAIVKVLFQKRYQHKTKMVPGISVTAR
jgi:hypothetical protein